MKSIHHDIQVEKSGFVIDCKNFVFGASPDSRVVDLLEDPVYGLVEIKCPEEYKDFNPRDICYISKNPCIQVDEYQNVKLRKDHYMTKYSINLVYRVNLGVILSYILTTALLLTELSLIETIGIN